MCGCTAYQHVGKDTDTLGIPVFTQELLAATRSRKGEKEEKEINAAETVLALRGKTA